MKQFTNKRCVHQKGVLIYNFFEIEHQVRFDNFTSNYNVVKQEINRKKLDRVSNETKKTVIDYEYFFNYV